MASKLRVLVIDDQPQRYEAIARAIEAAGDQVVARVADRGPDLHATVQSVQPDVVIIDWLLQGRVSGAKAASSIRQAHPDVGIIVITVPQEPITEDPARGIDAVLRMPLAGFDLTAVVRKIVAPVPGLATGV